MASGAGRFVTGSYVGTGAAKDVKLDKVGFQPRRVTIYRMSTRFDKVEHVEGMDAGTGILDKGDDGVRSVLSTQAITLTATGFSLGTAVSVNTVAENYRYTAEE